MVGEEPGGENSPHLWLPPTRVTEGCTSTAGYPDGRHHALVKAAEARLAFQMGAVEIALMPDPDAPDDNAVLAETVAVREALPHPARLLLFVDLARHNLHYLATSGVDGFVVPGWGKCESPIPVVRILREEMGDLKASLRATEEGAGHPDTGDSEASVNGAEQARAERIVYLRQK